MSITEDEITAALLAHARPWTDGRWVFTHLPHSEQSARGIVEACLMLGLPVTDLVTSQVWLALVYRVVDLQRRVDELERR